MAEHFAQAIINGRDYTSIFKIGVYKRYQKETDDILIREGYTHLIVK